MIPAGLRHVAVIMDGNGRWARERGWPRTRGHKEGIGAVRECVTESARAGLEWLTLFALSTENFRTRPATEVRYLMGLLRRFLVNERPTLMENGIRLRSCGRVHELPAKVVATLRETERLSAGNRGMILCLALNYGGQAEIVDAARSLAEECASGRLDPADIDEDRLRSKFYRTEMPDVDLLIRTAGEHRVSNFLLWQIAYAEIHSSRKCWPDFRKADLEAACAEFARRKRKFGGLQPRSVASPVEADDRAKRR
jgi:undecaprenyl diphosphate synthase